MSEQRDIVERLRHPLGASPAEVSEAADAIERLRNLYEKAWAECLEHRDPGAAGHDAEGAHDLARREAGLETP